LQNLEGGESAKEATNPRKVRKGPKHPEKLNRGKNRSGIPGLKIEGEGKRKYF